ncbi:hypothetical protein [Paenibacillus methanolicus]|uniref:DUF4064 domain-containing protein n=1 Tax=Paenibacillus methanolicus TaxID=582686 RepID=A0A5S5BW54_9BACL|nr:hypothetical protein [Paenibacillus methanolicus]TYP71214.1 hypothetical protein BCM02_110164 [Paenibacillus methanolicus]
MSDSYRPHEHTDGYPPFAPPDPHDAPAPQKQSGLGIASFIIGIASIAGVIASIFIITSFIMNDLGLNGNMIEIDAENMGIELLLGGLIMMGSVLLALLGLILGIIGACMRSRRKAFAIVGIVLNALLVVLVGALFLIGILKGATAI